VCPLTPFSRLFCTDKNIGNHGKNFIKIYYYQKKVMHLKELFMCLSKDTENNVPHTLTIMHDSP